MTDKHSHAAPTEGHPLDDAPVCGCGSLRQAVDEELRSLANMLAAGDAHHCLHWYVARATAASVVVRFLAVMDAGATDDPIHRRLERVIGILLEGSSLDYISEHLDALLERPEAVN